MVQYLAMVVHDNIRNTNAFNDTFDAIESMKDQLNDNEEVTTSFNRYNPDRHIEWVGPYSGGRFTPKDEVVYIEQCLEELYQKDLTQDGDSRIIIDGFDVEYGYGHGGVSYETDDGQMLMGARALYTPNSAVVADPVDTFQNIVIQEMAHNFNVPHKKSSYDVYNGVAYSATPMATSYAYTMDDVFNRDTCAPGGDSVPLEFVCWNYGPENGSGSSWCDGCQGLCRHTSTMTPCTMSNIDSNAPL